MSEPAFSFKNEVMKKADLNVDNCVNVDHAVCWLRMQQCKQIASVIFLDQ
jgi:hypothetical protein